MSYYIVKNKEAVLEFFEVINQEWEIVSFEKHVITQAIESCKVDKNRDFEDSLQCFCAKESDCDALLHKR